VHVLCTVAALTRRAQFLLADNSRVAGMTIDFAVLSDQRKLGISVVIELLRFPSTSVVTLAAILSQTRRVPVVGRVTAVAFLSDLVLHATGFVTRETVDVGVRALEGKFRFLEVIELSGFPTGDRVAFAAVAPAPLSVYVVGRMTGHALLRRVLVTITEVTGETGDVRMFAVQRELRFAVIEFRLVPARWSVAGAAVVSEFSRVRIFFAMTVAATRRRFTVFLAGLMAGSAIDERVLRAQRKVRVVVYECHDIHSHDVGATSEMIGVTSAALRAVNRKQTSVKTFLAAHIRGHILMAIETQRRLPFAIAAIVAVLAFFFVLRVRIRHLARHQ